MRLILGEFHNCVLDDTGVVCWGANNDGQTDGLLLLRYLFGFDGATLVKGAVGDGAARTMADGIKTYIQARIETGSWAVFF